MDTTFTLIEKAHNGDKASEEELVEKNMPLVHSCAGKFRHRFSDYDDLVQIGAIGLVKAIRRFDADYGVAFSTYAVPLIIGEIKRFLRDDGMIKVSRILKETKQKVLLCHDELFLKLGREPSLSEISEHTGLESEKIILAMDACSACESLQRPISPDGTSELTLADTLPDSFNISDHLDTIALKSALNSLSERERKIMILRYFCGKTQAEISSVIGVSQVQISRIEKKVLLHLKTIMK